jgi:putative redox protein
MSESAGSTMRAVIRRRNGAVHFVAETGNGGVVPIDGAPSIGGQGLGARPMELLLSALGACAGIDVVGILAKQRQELDDLTVTVEGERGAGEPSVFTRIHVHFSATGQVDEAALRRAVELSMEKYCSVARVVERTAAITYTQAIAPTAATAPGASTP